MLSNKKTPTNYKNKILQIYEGEKALTQIQTVRIMSGLKDEQIRETANESLQDNPAVPLYCDNPKHDLYRKCVGGGVCLAKKYKRLGVAVDQICQGCRSKVIIQTLNYIFDTYYGGKYKAEWRSSRRAVKPIKEKKPRVKKNREEIEEILQSMPTQNGVAKPRKGRPKGSKNKTTAPKSRRTKNVEPAPIEQPAKKRRGRPVGSKNKAKIEEASIKNIEPESVQKKPRGRPRKLPLVAAAA